MNKIINIERGEGKFSSIVIGNVISDLDQYIPACSKVFVITDSNVRKLYADIMNRYHVVEIGLGEENKTISTVEKIYAELLENGADRSSYIVAIGGGIVTDIAGYVASTYMRGIRFGFVATTLLAQVDASVGGKNGVNFMGYKNMVGCFNQPDFVLCDISVLKTLPERELRTGLAEIIKAGLISEDNLFSVFERYSFYEIISNDAIMSQIISSAVEIKANIVGEDQFEGGVRKKLNLGHTFAHAIEKCSREFLHGEAVAIGLIYAAKISAALGKIDYKQQQRIADVITAMGYKTDCGIEIKKLINAIKLDKKKKKDTIDFIVMDGIGRSEIVELSFDRIEQILAPKF